VSGHFLYFLAAQMILNAKSGFLAVSASLRWLIMLSASSGFPCFLLVSRVWDISSGIGPCFPLAGGLCNFYANARGIQPIQRQVLLVQYKQQANPMLSINYYTPLVISRNDKNKQLTLLSQIHLVRKSL
jgi:hypothetical protein